MTTLDWRQRSNSGSKFQQEYCAGRGGGAQHKLGSRYRQLCLLWTSIQLQQLFSRHISPSLSFCSKYHRASFLYNTENVFQFGLKCHAYFLIVLYKLYCTKLIQTSSSNVSYTRISLSRKFCLGSIYVVLMHMDFMYYLSLHKS